jgi:hypothetical protein
MNEADSINWDLIKRDFILSRTSNKKGKTLTLKQLSQKYNIPYGTLKNKSSKEKWIELVNQKNKEVTIKVTTEIQNQNILSEIDVRMKNFESATVCLDRGLEKLSQLTEEEISPQLAIKMVELGIKGRHSSAGLADNFNINNTNLNINLKPGEETFEENQEKFKKQSLLAAKFIKHLDAYTKKHGAIDI